VSDDLPAAAELTDEELVGQVLVGYAYGGGAHDVSAASAAGNQRLAGVDTPAEIVDRYRLGGVILVARSADDPTAGTNPTTNVDSPAQVRELTGGLRTAARVPLLVGTDQEYGVVTRIRSGIVQLPSAMSFGAAADPALTQRAWAAAGADLAALGVNVDFAPVADVLDPAGTGGVIGSRSFGSDPASVARQVAAVVRGLRSGGVAATLKHFPGQGYTTVDSHVGLPVLPRSVAELEAVELPPFVAGIGAGADLVMSGHVEVPAIEGGVPASFSARVLVDLLRHRLGFEGVVVCDALRMAPARRWPPGESAVRALLAGNDLLLQPPDLAAAHRGLLGALDRGLLPRARLVEAVGRILALKRRLAGGPPPGELSTVDGPPARDAALAVAAKAVTVLKGRYEPRGRLAVTASAGRERARDWLVEALRAEGIGVGGEGAAGVHLVGYGDGAEDLSPDAGVTVTMDTPYLLARCPSPVLLATYSSCRASMVALAAVLAGHAVAPGRCPVPVRF
jgi:beta-N-acetylhexosaminidase